MDADARLSHAMARIGVTRRVALGSLTSATVGTIVRGQTLGLRSGTCAGPDLAGFSEYCFIDSQGRSHQSYVVGSGPPVILLHEISGLTDQNLAAASRLATAGFTIIAPLLFGEPGGEGRALHYLQTVCGREQFACNSGESTSPHVQWLREFAGAVRQRWPDGRGVGVIGMCLTGAFPLAMLRERAVVAPVLCQPTIPFNFWTRLGWFTAKDALGIDAEDLLFAKTARDVPILGIRYEGDWRCRRQRFDRLTKEFGPRFYRLELDGSHHSTLSSDHCDLASAEVIAFLNQRLRTAPDPSIGPFPRLSWLGVQQPSKLPECTDTK